MRTLTRRSLITALGLGGIMTLRADDLTSLHTAKLLGPGQPMEYRDGVIEAWDPETWENEVRVGRVLLTNLPVQGAAEAESYEVGDKVWVTSVGSTMAITGHLVEPGSAQVDAIRARLSNELGERVVSADVATAEGTTSATFTDLATPGPAVTVDIGASGKALVIVSARETSTTSTPVMSYAVSGATTVAADDADALAITVTGGATLLGAASRLSLVTGLNPGSTTFTAKYRRVGATAITFDQRNITVFAL